MVKRMAFELNISRCSGCFACIVACQDQNDAFGNDVAFRQVVTQEQENPSGTTLSFFSIACLHCGDAPCLMVCPTGAIYQNDTIGSIEVNRERCIGCHSCLSVCPFGAPHFAADGKMVKCDMCSARQAHGLEPACVRTCPTKALQVIPLEDLSKKKAEASSRQVLQLETRNSPSALKGLGASYQKG
jgi:Fe-S-cluster-containing dehydrogenase component